MVLLEEEAIVKSLIKEVVLTQYYRMNRSSLDHWPEQGRVHRARPAVSPTEDISSTTVPSPLHHEFSLIPSS